LPSAPIVRLRHVINYFRSKISKTLSGAWIPSHSGIHCLVIPGNETVKTVSARLFDAGLDVRPVFHPTVPKGKERLRICLHAFNTEEQIDHLITELERY